MILNFPDPNITNPYTQDGKTWLYDFVKGVWNNTPTNTQTYIQPTQPTDLNKFMWIQTGLPNNGFSLWFNDGL